VIDPSNMTANEIDKAIEELRKLHRSGEITEAQAVDLDRLRLARKRIGQAGRRRWL
jgi:hypothetical protein